MKDFKHRAGLLLCALLLTYFSLLCLTRPYGIALTPAVLGLCAAFALPLLLRGLWQLLGLIPIGLIAWGCVAFWDRLLLSLCLPANRFIEALNAYNKNAVLRPFKESAGAEPFFGLAALALLVTFLTCVGALLFRSVIFSALPLGICLALGIFTNRFPPLWAAAGAVGALILLCLLLLPKSRPTAPFLYAAGLLISLGIIAVSALTAPWATERLAPFSPKLRGFQRSVVQRLEGASRAAPREARLNNQSLRFTGKPLMAVTADGPLEADLYLREAVYGAYLGGAWGPLPQEEFTEFTRRSGVTGEDVLLQGYTYRETGGDRPMELTVSRFDGGGALTPYNFLPDGFGFGETTYLLGDGYLVSPENPLRYEGYSGLEDLPSGRAPLPDYDRFTAAQYTEAPDLPRLRQLAESFRYNSIGELYMQIAATLDASAAYSLELPGNAYTGDYVENFLFTQKEGYCQHFASAAVLLFRYNGVRARYATGYVLPASALREEGETATVQDAMAHAWPEIYIPDRGWVPAEVTPGGVRRQMETLPLPASPTPLPAETPEAAPQRPAATSFTPVGEKETQEISPLLREILRILALTLTLALCVLVLLARRRRIRARRFKSTRLLLRDLFAMGEFCLKKRQGAQSDRDFLSECFAACGLAQADALAQAGEKHAFSGQSLTREEKELILRMYERLQAGFRVKLSPPRRLVFDWVFCY